MISGRNNKSDMSLIHSNHKINPVVRILSDSPNMWKR